MNSSDQSGIPAGDPLSGNGLTGIYRLACFVNVAVLYAVIVFGWLIRTQGVAEWLTSQGINLATNAGQIPFVWTRIRPNIIGLVLCGLSIYGVFAILQSWRVSLYLFGLVLFALLTCSFCFLAFSGGRLQDFAALNDEVVFCSAILVVVYLARFGRGLFSMQFGISDWIIRFFQNLLFVGLYAFIAIISLATWGDYAVLAVGGLSGVALLLMKPAES